MSPTRRGGSRTALTDRVRGLYVIVDPEATRGRPVLEIAEAVLEGGASLVQLRDKTRDPGEMLPEARAIRALCESRGAVFPTSTMGKGRRPVVGTDLVARAKEIAAQPIVAIGGIDRHNAAQVIQAGADCICAVGAITLAHDPKKAAQEMVDAIQES